MTPAQMCEALDILVNWAITTDVYKTATEDMEGFTEELRANLEEMKKDIVASNATAILNFYLHGKTQIITQAELRVDWFVEKEPATFLATMKLGADPIQSLKYSAEISLDIPEQDKETVAIVYERSHAHNLPGRKLVVSYDDEEYVVMEIQINSVTNAFTLEMFNGEMSVSGVCKSENGKVYMTLDLKEVGDLSLTFTGDAQAPAMPEYTNICTLSEMELLRLFVEYLDLREVDLTVEGPDGDVMDYCYLSHKNCSYGELLEDQLFATLDEQGRIISLRDYDAPADVATQIWEVYINGELVDGNLYEICTDYYAEIVIRDVTVYPEEGAAE